jgi:hypothetical protein
MMAMMAMTANNSTKVNPDNSRAARLGCSQEPAVRLVLSLAEWKVGVVISFPPN